MQATKCGSLRSLTSTLALGILLVFAPLTAHAIAFTFSTPISGDTVEVVVALTEIPEGDGVEISVSIPAGEGDLLGLFGNVADESLVAQMAVDDPSGIITQWQFLANKVSKVGGGNTMAPVKQWDWGVRIGQQGSAGGAIESASFRLTAPGLTVAELVDGVNQGWALGVRIQGTHGSEGSSKLGLEAGAPPDGTPPNIQISSPPEGALLNETPVVVTGTITGTEPSVDVNGVEATVVDGTFTASVPLTEGPNSLDATATNALGTDSDQVNVVLDEISPQVTITAPIDGSLTTLSELLVTGTVTDASAITNFTVNGVDIPVVNGAFTTTVPLVLGSNPIVAVAVDAAANAGSDTVAVTRGVPPTIAIGAPVDGTIVNQTTLTVSGTVGGTGTVAVDVNGIAATVTGTSFTVDVALVEGGNTLTATAASAFGSSQDAVSVTLDTIAPSVTISAPTDGAEFTDDSILVTGTVADASPITDFTINGQTVGITGGAFSTLVSLVLGANPITVAAVDAAANTTGVSITVTRVQPQICTPGESVACYDGPAGTLNVGACIEGSQVCAPDGLSLGPCTGSIEPTAESCNGIDDDCDGTPDEGFGVGNACGTGELGICTAGTLACTSLGLVCERVSDPAPEVCDDGIDQDCDGADCITLSVTIDAPAADLVTLDDFVNVSGSVGPGVIAVTVNRIPANLTGSSFSALVPLAPGPNMIVAVAADGLGNSGTDSVDVIRDDLAPTVAIESPGDGFQSSSNRVTVTGAVDDPVGGGDELLVEVNGVPATVQNGTFIARDIPLFPGPNEILAVALDSVGNAGSDSIEVRFALPVGPHIELDSGDGQVAPAGQPLPEPLAVRLVDAAGNPLAARVVQFEVTRNDGILAPLGGGGNARSVIAATNGSGVAEVLFTLGARSGEGNNRVRATSAGVAGEAVFSASALTGAPHQTLAEMGANQSGLTSSPLPEPFEVSIVDLNGNPVAGTPVVFRVEAGGGRFDGATEQTVTSGPDGRARAALALGPSPGVNNNQVSASFAGQLTLPASFFASALLAGPASETRLAGVVLDTSDTPIPGATLEIEGTSVTGVTDAEGQFLLSNVPVGPVLLRVDPGTSPRPEIFPPLEFETVTVAGQQNRLSIGSIHIPPLPSGGAVVGGPADVTISVPGVEGMELTVFANSVTFADGSTTGSVSINLVHFDRVPMPPPSGSLAVPIAWTVQPAGAQFDPPARIQLPNSGLPPGRVVDLFQFNHALNRFISIGTGTVSEDGSVIVSDPGFGITASGWGWIRVVVRFFCGLFCGECERGTDSCGCEPDPDLFMKSCDDKNACTGKDVGGVFVDGTCNAAGECEDGELSATVNGSDKDKKSLTEFFKKCQEDDSTLEELCEDPDFPGLTFNAGRGNAIVDSFGSNDVDLNDLEAFDRERCAWSSDSCQNIAHFTQERLDRSLGFDQAHKNGFDAESRYRESKGLPGRVTDSPSCGTVAAPAGCIEYDDGRVEKFFLDPKGDITRVECMP